TPTFVCQGEKNADDLIRRGLQATTVICNDWAPECVGSLAGYDLFILEDHDESGRKLAAKAQRALGKVAKSTPSSRCNTCGNISMESWDSTRRKTSATGSRPEAPRRG